MLTELYEDGRIVVEENGSEELLTRSAASLILAKLLRCAIYNLSTYHML